MQKDPISLVVFGATGDLMARKILPSLFYLYKEKKLPRGFRVIGVSRRDISLIIAPHPFFFISSIGKDIEEYINYIDGIEHSAYYTNLLNRNKPALKIAKKYHKPMVGNSDAHYLYQIGTNYTLVDAEKNIEGVIRAIKKNKIQLNTQPISLFKFIKIFADLIFLAPLKGLKRKA